MQGHGEWTSELFLVGSIRNFRPEDRKALLGGEFAFLLPQLLAMSRCFPFPPPGYEQKARPDDLNFIEKEKHKQKKHKDKKEKDKKRKEKERSEGNLKEDKDRKKKKHKDKKDKKKDKKRSLEEKKIVEQFGNQNGVELGSKPCNGIQDHGILVELGKRVRNDGGATDIQMVQKISLAEQRKTNLLGKLEENSNGMLDEPYDDIKNKREHNCMAHGQSLKVHTKGLGNGFVGKFPGENQIKVEGGSCQVDKVETRKDGKDKNGCGNNAVAVKGDYHQKEDGDKNRKGEERKRKKEKKKERSSEKIKERASDGNFLDCRDSNPPDLPKDNRERKLPKHNEPLLNGFLHGNRSQPINMSSPALSSHQVSQTGRGLRPPQNTINLHVKKDADAVIMDQKVSGKLSSSQTMVKNVRIMEPGRSANNSTAEDRRASIKDHVVSNGHNSSQIIGVELKIKPHQATSNLPKVEPCQTTSNLSRPALTSHQVSKKGSGLQPPQNAINLHVEKDAVSMDKKVNNKLSSSQSVIRNVRIMEPYRTTNNSTAEDGRALIKDHAISNGRNSSHIMGVEWKMEQCQSSSKLAKIVPIDNNGHADDKFPTSSSFIENGRKLAAPNSNKVVDRQSPDAIYNKMDNKEVKINGMLEGKKHSKSTSSSKKAKEKIDASMKPLPPHPDSRYLSQILMIPKVEWPQYDDDQEWLFGCSGSQAKRPKLSSKIDPIKPVWAEAMQVDSADITALPYVIPY